MCKTRDFRDWVKLWASRQSQSLEHLRQKILKNLSKCFSQLEVLPAKESRGKPRKSLTPLATWPSAREQVARLSRKKH